MNWAPGLARRLADVSVLVWLVAACLSVVSTTAGFAHEVRPAYLDLKEVTPGTFDVLFKGPMLGDLRLALGVRFSGRIEPTTPILSRIMNNAMVQTWQFRAIEPLAGQEVGISGLENTVTDALVRVEFADGRAWVQRLTPALPRAIIPAEQSGWQVAATYLRLGIEHILRGIDHLLFVLGLILITANTRQLVNAISAFTAAHSITLAAATLGFVHVPPRPVEAAIALSIAFVAIEIIHTRQGRRGMAARAPWLIAFAFGLLHGFGFAGALSEIGMPAGHVPVALLFFNVGVEMGQLLFVAAVLSVAALVRIGRPTLPRWSTLVVPYLIGSVAMFWVIQRISVF